MECKVHIALVLDEKLGDLSRSDGLALERGLQSGEQRVLLRGEVVVGQHFEGRECAVGQLDLHVHAARAQQRFVQLLHVVGGEHEDALVAAA